jgi:hypothetical protein
MKTVISAIVIVVLMIGAQSAFAISDYQLGFRQGYHDMIHNHFIILGPGTTTEYANGYNHGLTAGYAARQTN